MSTRNVATTDGLNLAVYEAGDPADPTLVAVHGYPDDHTVWDGVLELLAADFHVVTYDVRGAGASDAPSRRSGYRIPQLVADLGAVIDATAAGKNVHLIAHDWGSIQCWDALRTDALGARILSYTSISGPSLDMAGRWLRGAGHPVSTLKQLADSWYVAAFQLPRLPELLLSRGVLGKAVAHSKRAGDAARPQAVDRHIKPRDAINGLELYRANFTGRMARPRPAPIQVPVQVLAPTDDAHVTVALQTQAPAPYVATLTSHVIPGNHWVVEQDPERIARHIVDFIKNV
ncbi:alpha/beta fold hydrolase [Nocardioides sp. Kera G14]|uniref:alpha/beta fold hydrolase n=1 Tax=Nocardioides sp. Kera G14 TaxID=2884264 RepID=UPI001D12DA41|nr:alpha/beta fold hydrolase [Nocardioides sp. Kera G14]UDY23565.1 alpha/beta fold hydrolase [Nocardioides sp. Kera G14]